MYSRKYTEHLDCKRTYADLEDNNLWSYPFIRETCSVEFCTDPGYWRAMYPGRSSNPYWRLNPLFEGESEWVWLILPSVRKMSRGADLECWPHYCDGVFYTRGQWIDSCIAELDESRQMARETEVPHA
jgi:hypothetical protein